MSSHNLDVYMPVLILIGLALTIVAIVFIGKIIRPKNPSAVKESPYECGEIPVGTAWASFNVRFYVIALIFLVFDVEAALMFPVATVFKRFTEIGAGGIVLGSFLIFISVLVSGLVYCWKKGDLDWVTSFNLDQEQTMNKVKDQ